ncbi:MAG: hypothetical protein DMF00_17000 [Verrucomicrobia bacterium]|nr:MAG: hypothetical protein DMF00_17000 [Verrucomicrobiota bacterium]
MTHRYIRTDNAGHPERPLQRIAIENQWFALRGRVVAVKAETDCDLHIELQDKDQTRGATSPPVALLGKFIR